MTGPVGSPPEERPGAGQWLPERPGLRSLEAAVQECRGCELWRDATQAVMGRGRRSAHPPAWVLATTHPSAVLRSEDRAAALAGLVDDLRVAARQLAAAG